MQCSELRRCLIKRHWQFVKWIIMMIAAICVHGSSDQHDFRQVSWVLRISLAPLRISSQSLAWVRQYVSVLLMMPSICMLGWWDILLKSIFFWKSYAPPPPEKEISQILQGLNDLYKFFFLNCIFYVHVIAVLLIFLCLHFYVRDYTRRNNLRRRRIEIRREHDRLPPRRRPGAVHRDHEIFRHILKKIREYIRYADGIDLAEVHAHEQVHNLAVDQ